jgi:hypothetical protein
LIIKNFANEIFITLTIQLAFISNGIQLLDISHHIVKFFKYLKYKKA